MHTRRIALALFGLFTGIGIYITMATHSHNTTLPLNQTVKEMGIIVLAHGGNPEWNNEVSKVCCAGLAEKYPTVVAFGMANAAEIQRAVDTLEALKVKKIAVVPLFISSHSELYRQTEYVLGLRQQPDPDFIEGMHRAMANPVKFIFKKVSLRDMPHVLAGMKDHLSMKLDQQVVSHTPFTMLPALNADHFVGEILAERAAELSTRPQGESVVIVAHGPINDADDAKWLADMQALGVFVRRHNFHHVEAATIRDDAPDATKNFAVKRLQTLVRTRAMEGDKVLIVPLLLSRGGIEKEIHHILKDLPYVYNEKTLLPHKNIERWLVSAIKDYIILTAAIAENIPAAVRMRGTFALASAALQTQP